MDLIAFPQMCNLVFCLVVCILVFPKGAGVQPSGVCIQSDLASQNHVGHSGGGSFVQASPQVPVS